MFVLLVDSIRSWTSPCRPTWRRTTSTSSRQSRRSGWGWRSSLWTSTKGRSRRTIRVGSEFFLKHPSCEVSILPLHIPLIRTCFCARFRDDAVLRPASSPGQHQQRAPAPLPAPEGRPQRRPHLQNRRKVRRASEAEDEETVTDRLSLKRLIGVSFSREKRARIEKHEVRGRKRDRDRKAKQQRQQGQAVE